MRRAGRGLEVHAEEGSQEDTEENPILDFLVLGVD